MKITHKQHPKHADVDKPVGWGKVKLRRWVRRWMKRQESE